MGIGLCLIQKHFHIITLPQESYFLSYAPIDISWSWILLLNLGTVLITLLLLLIPSALISKISPVKAIRFE
jgi:lipoprotein-releasing system permease protein